MITKDQLADDILKLSAEKLLFMFEYFSKLKNTKLNFIGADEVSKNVEHRSEIIIYGTDITLRVQNFYRKQDCIHFLENLYTDVTDKRIFDFFNELCNLTCGKLKEVLVEQGIVAALSLPIDINTSPRKILVSQEVLPYFKYGKVEDENGQPLLKFKLSVEIHQLDPFKDFDVNFKKEDDDDDVEFF